MDSVHLSSFDLNEIKVCYQNDLPFCISCCSSDTSSLVIPLGGGDSNGCKLKKGPLEVGPHSPYWLPGGILHAKIWFLTSEERKWNLKFFFFSFGLELWTMLKLNSLNVDEAGAIRKQGPN